MSSRWADSRPGKKLVTSNYNINLKAQSHTSAGGMVSYEDLLIAQYLDELRNTKAQKRTKDDSSKPSPYLQKLPHSDYTYKFRQRPMSATTVEPGTKPKIDAKFIADPNLWDPATPRTDEEGPMKYQVIPQHRPAKTRPASAPVKKTRYIRPVSAASTVSFYGRRPWSSMRPQSGKRIKSQYKKQPQTIRVTAFRNGSREPFVRLAAPNIKILLEFCTDKLALPFAARRIFLEDGVEVFDQRDIPVDAEIYISLGENYKDPYATTKRNIILSNGAKWTLSGLTLPEEGKKKVSKPRLSKRMKQLAGRKRVRIIVYRNGKCTEPVEIVADLDKLEEFLVACTAKLDLRSHARILFDLEGNEITCLTDTPVLDECLQQGGTMVLGPVWVSCGEGFSPSGTRDFLMTIKEVIRTRMKEAASFKKELTYMKEGEKEKVKLAIKILSMTEEEVEEALQFTEDDLDQLSTTLQKIKEKLEPLEGLVQREEADSSYRMQHIKTLSEKKAYRMVGPTGLRLKVHENGTVSNPKDFYFNIREAAKGLRNDKESQARLLQRLLDELSGTVLTANPKNPKLAPIAKKLFNQFGREIEQVYKLKTDDEIWVSFGEPYISPFIYCLQVIFDKGVGKDTGEKQVVLREQLTTDEIKIEMEEHENWDVSIGFPALYDFETVKYEGEKTHVENMAEMAELDQRGHFLHYLLDPKYVLYPEIIMNYKLPRGHKSLWPAESQGWVITKGGLIIFKPFPSLCLSVSEVHIETTLTGKDFGVKGYTVCLQKKMVGNPHQIWKFNPDATISSEAYPNLLLTYLGKKFGEETTNDEEREPQPEGLLPGHRVYLMLSEPLPKKEASLQRFALKQEKMQNLGQWKFNEATNPEWNKQALSWPVRADGKLNEDYDWPMEGFILPNAPKLHKKDKKVDQAGLAPLRLLVVRNGERDLSKAMPVVGPNLTNYIRDLNNKPKQDKKHRRTKSQEPVDTNGEDVVDTNLHCRDLTISELEFSMFLDHCTSMLNLPFAARRMFDERGNEHFSLKKLKRDQIVYVTCGEIWTDPSLSKQEQNRRFVLSQLSQDVAKMRQYASLRNPEKYVLEVDSSGAPGSPLVVNRQWSREDEEMIEQERKSAASSKSTVVDEDPLPVTSHDLSHQKAEQRLNNLKWPWERLVNVNNSFDNDPEALKYTNPEMYEKFKPKQIVRIPRDQFQHFRYEDGYIAWSANTNLVLGVAEPEGRVVEVTLVKRRPDDIYQLWLMKENGEIRPRHNQQIVLTVSMPTNEPYAEDEEGRPLTFAGCKVTLQSRKTNQYGKAHQRWRYDAETGLIHAFDAELADKEITAANKADVCTYAIANTSKIDQPGYIAEVPTQMPSDRGMSRKILVCTSCARAMRGRYKLEKLPARKEFSCAMGIAKKLKLQQIGSFRVLNGKVDLSTHEYQLTLQDWEQKLATLMEETSAKTITKEINVARTVQTCKVLAYKNGEGRLRQGEIICGSSVEGILNQCTSRLGLNKAACRMFTEDGTIIVEMEDLIDWAVQNYRSLMADHLERLYQGKQVEQEDDGNRQVRGQGEGQDSQTDDRQQQDTETAEVDQKEADKAAKQREFLLSQVNLPSRETILRYPIEIWISSGKPFVLPEVVESKIENRKKKRAFRAAVSLELDMEKHVLRQMKGRRLDEMNPGELKGTKNTNKPVVVEGHWEEPTPEEQVKHDNVHKLQEHLAEVKHNQKEKLTTSIVDTSRRLYKQPDTKRIMVYPNGESVERAVYIWGDSLQELLDSATIRLNLWQSAKKFYTMEGKEIMTFNDIQKDELLCVSTGKPFKHGQVTRLDIEVKANWSRAHKQYGMTSTDVTVQAPQNPKVNVDPFGPPELALPLTSVEPQPRPVTPIADRRPRPMSAKPPPATS